MAPAGTGRNTLTFPRRVLIVTPFGLEDRGTVAYRTWPLARFLAGRGVAVRVLLAAWDSPARVPPSGHGLPAPTVVPLRGPTRLRGRSGVRQMAAWLLMARQALAHIQAWQPDVVHLVKPVTVPFLVLLALRGRPGVRRRSPRVVLDCDDLEQAWRAVPWARVWRWWGSWAERWAWRAADGVVVASHALYDWVRRAREDRRTPFADDVHWVPNPVLASGPSDHVKRLPRVIVPTRLLDISPDRLGGWLAEMAHAVPEARFLVVGPPPDRLRLLHHTLVRTRVRPRVTLVRGQDVAAYTRLLAASRVGVYAVEDTPANRAKCPRRVLDMMAVGVPVIAVDVGEPAWLLDDAGILVPAQGPALAAALRDVWADEERRATLAARAHHRAHTMFSLEAVGARLLRAYTCT